jgi:hypothetical protein
MAPHRGPGTFVQVGATRDGLDPYLAEARRRGMPAVLVETASYLGLRRRLGRQMFDIEIPVADPADPGQVQQATKERAPDVVLLLGGFERYNASAHAAALGLGIPLVRDTQHRPFMPVDKLGQRHLLAERAPEIAQPGYVAFELDRTADAMALVERKRLRYPLVVKPSDGGGGLGVFLVDGPRSLAAALERLGAMTNYGGGAFARIVVEEYIEGTEYSIQAVAFRGAATLLTACEKLIVRERSASDGLAGFRETAHIAQPGALAPDRFWRLAQRCVDAMSYTRGPFHIDFIESSSRAYFVEMGFRLSGIGVAGLVERSAGVRWAELVFAIHLDDRLPDLPVRRGVAVGQATLASDAEIAFFHECGQRGDDVEIVSFPAAPAVGSDDGDALLASDRMRHGGFKGRVFLTAGDPAAVRQRFRAGIHTRLELGACVD